MIERAASSKSVDAYRTISEVAEDLGLPQHVLRFWETRFPQIKPLKRAGGRRFYRPEDVELLRAVKTLLYNDGYTIKGVLRMLRDQGPRSLTALTATPSLAAQNPADDVLPPLGRPANRPSRGNRVDPPMPERQAPPSEELSPELEGGTPDISSLSDPAFQPVKNATIDVANRLEAVLYDLIECERLIRHASTI